MVPILIVIVSFILDGILTNFLPYMTNNLSFFTPLFTMTCIYLIYPFYKKKEKNFFITIFIVGIIYDLFYTNLLFFNAILFLIIGFSAKLIHKNFENSPIKLVLYIICIVSIYEITNALIILFFNLVPITPYKILYKISHSLILNIIYAELIYLIIKLLPKKHKKNYLN